MAERITIFRETTADFSTVEAFYASVVYFQAVTADCIVMSAKREKIVGAVRLSPGSGVLILRGMQIAPFYQRRGIGTRMLREVAKFMGSRECFCLPHSWLESFYGTIGFAKMKMATLRLTFAKGLANIRRNIDN